MANKFKKVTPASRKPQQTQDNTNLRTVMGLVAVLLVVIVVIVVFYHGSGTSGASGGNGQTTTQQSQQQQGPTVAQAQQEVTSAEQQLKSNSTDINLQKALGNAYYDLGSAYYQSKDTTNGQKNFANAVVAYQKFLAKQFNIDVETDMATSAFYGNEPDVAEAAFKTAIAKQPDFMPAHLNYGIFLLDARKDKTAAKAQFEIVANQTKDAQSASAAKQMLQSL